MDTLRGNRGVNLIQGETLTLFASAARTAAAADEGGDAIYVGGERRHFILILDVTAAASTVADTLDVYVDWSFDASTWYNGVHFTQVLGNGGAVAYFTNVGDVRGLTSDGDISADQAANATLRDLHLPYVRGRYTLVDDSGSVSFTFSLKAFAL